MQAPSSSAGGSSASASLGDEAMEERNGTIINGNGADSLPIFSSFTRGRGRDAASGTPVNPGEYVIVNSDALQQQVSNQVTGNSSSSMASAFTESDIEETLKRLDPQRAEALVHSLIVMRPILEEHARLLVDRNNATGDVAVAGAGSGHPDMLEKMEKILSLFLGFSLSGCVTAYPIVKGLPAKEGVLAYGLIGLVPAVLFLGLLPTLFTKSPKAGTFALSALLLASGIVIGLFTWALCSLNPSLCIPIGVAGALLFATIILMVALFVRPKRV